MTKIEILVIDEVKILKTISEFKKKKISIIFSFRWIKIYEYSAKKLYPFNEALPKTRPRPVFKFFLPKNRLKSRHGLNFFPN